MTTPDPFARFSVASEAVASGNPRLAIRILDRLIADAPDCGLSDELIAELRDLRRDTATMVEPAR